MAGNKAWANPIKCRWLCLYHMRSACQEHTVSKIVVGMICLCWQRPSVTCQYSPSLLAWPICSDRCRLFESKTTIINNVDSTSNLFFTNTNTLYTRFAYPLRLQLQKSLPTERFKLCYVRKIWHVQLMQTWISFCLLPMPPHPQVVSPVQTERTHQNPRAILYFGPTVQWCSLYLWPMKCNPHTRKMVPLVSLCCQKPSASIQHDVFQRSCDNFSWVEYNRRRVLLATSILTEEVEDLLRTNAALQTTGQGEEGS